MFLEKKRNALDIKEGKVHCRCLHVAKISNNINKNGPNYGKKYYHCDDCCFILYNVCFHLSFSHLLSHLLSLFNLSERCDMDPNQRSGIA